jgi:putative chitinase
MTREGLFAAVRPFAPGQKFSSEQVGMIDALADGFGLSRAANDDPAGTIDPAKFAVWAPKAVLGTLPALQAAAAAHGFSGTVLAHWLGQMYVESGGFSVLSENLNYSVESLTKMFGRHRISLADADRYGRKPGQLANQEALANTLYGGEWGKANLGNTQPGDGWRFRGSGFKQITGRANTEKSGFTPEELRTDPVKSAKAAADFFVRAGCVDPARRDDVEAVTRKINGGVNGLDDRIIRTRQAKAIIA